MGDRMAALVAAAVLLPPTVFLIWLLIRNLIARLRDLRDAIDQTRRRNGEDR
ncbi:hypothetical protein [Sphingomonas sp.]|uniref:hypothetical protein n=1 Tax=Sphingomonas sp. TaxID=28214 RepID=UPI00286D9B5E|nr:hypothetical protein [Sphingomonas sp.]